MELQATRYAPRLLRGIPLVKRPERVDVQVAQHDADLLGAWVVFVDQLSQTLGDIQLGTLLGDLDVPPSPMWLEEGKQVARPVALVDVLRDKTEKRRRSAPALHLGAVYPSRA